MQKFSPMTQNKFDAKERFAAESRVIARMSRNGKTDAVNKSALEKASSVIARMNREGVTAIKKLA